MMANVREGFCCSCSAKWKIEASVRGSGYTTLCATCRVPHCLMTRHRDGWVCDYCGQWAPNLEVLRSTSCTHYYSRCTSCGGAPYCFPDCKGMAEVLKDAEKAGARLIGF